MTLTLTQVLLRQQELLLFGQQVSDFYLRGDLGLGLDPKGPWGFAWIHAYKAATDARQNLAAPLLLSVSGAGVAGDSAAMPGERCWRVYRDDGAICIVPSRRSFAHWLGLDAAARL